MEQKAAGNYRKRELPPREILVRVGANYFKETNHGTVKPVAETYVIHRNILK